MTRRWRVRRVGWRTVEIRPAAGLGTLIGLTGGAVIAAGALARLLPLAWQWTGAHAGKVVLVAVVVAGLLFVGRSHR